MATKPWEKKAPERRRGRSKLRVIFQLVVAYIAYLALWKCPVNQPLACHCPPCETLHSVYDNHVAPLWTEYGQPYYEKIEPTTTPLIAKLEPVYTQASQSLRAKVEPHYYQLKAMVLARLEPLVPHWTVVRAQLQKYQAIAEPHAKTMWAQVVAQVKVAYAKGVELYIAHVAPKLSVYLRDLDRRQVELATKVSDWANAKYQDALNQAHGWLSEKIQNTMSRTGSTFEGEPSATTETGTPATDASATVMSATTTPETTGGSEATVPADAQDADDYIQESSSSSSSTSSSSTSVRKRIPVPETETVKHPKMATGHGPMVYQNENLKGKAKQAQEQDSEAQESSSSSSSATKPDGSRKPPRLSWSARVARTAKSANKNLDVDSKEFQEKIIEEAKPGIMKKLRELSAYGDEQVKLLAKLVLSIEDDEADTSDPADIYDQFDTTAQHLQSQMMGVRADCESLAQSVLDKVGDLRKEALESLDDFFEIVLVEAGKDAAENNDEDEWEHWQSYSKLKKQLVDVRKEVEDHEPDMETVNVALRESQQAAILLTQEFIQHIKTLRARAQFHMQQKAVLEAKKKQDEEIDASWYVIDSEEAETQAQQPLHETLPIDEEPEIIEHFDGSDEITSPETVSENLEEPVDLPDLVDDSDSEPYSEPETVIESETEETETLFLTETIFQTRINTHTTI